MTMLEALTRGPSGLPLATWSPCTRYRYTLRRVLRAVDEPRVVTWILLNPSTADDGPARTSSFTLQWRALPERIVAAAERLRGVQIECRPALDLLSRYAGADVLVFADPPYLGEVRSRRKIYRKEMMGAAEHEELLAGLRAHPGMVSLTHYRCPLYDDLLTDWMVIELNAIAEHGQRRVEGLYLNPALVSRLQVGRQQLDLPGGAA